jgi:hypothetical protein
MRIQGKIFVAFGKVRVILDEALGRDKVLKGDPLKPRLS